MGRSLSCGLVVCGLSLLLPAGAMASSGAGPERQVLALESHQRARLVFETENSWREVLRTMRRESVSLHGVTVSWRGLRGQIMTTSEHPFYEPVERRWLRARELSPGDVLADSQGGELRVAAAGAVPDRADVFNLYVAQAHNYYVRADGAPIAVLVHNTKGDEWGSKTPTMAHTPTTQTLADDVLDAGNALLRLDRRPQVVLDDLVDRGVLDGLTDAADLAARLRRELPVPVNITSGTGPFKGKIDFVEVQLALNRQSRLSTMGDLWFLRLDGKWFYAKTVKTSSSDGVFPEWRLLDPDYYTSY